MSFCRENVCWQSEDGTWSLGFFRVAWVDYDGDPEWDVEYDFESFEWLTVGHRSSDAANQAWDGANPGGGWEYEWDPTNERSVKEIARYNKMAEAFKLANPYRPPTREEAYYGRRLNW